MKKIITLSENTIDREDISKLSSWLQTNPHLTKGEVTKSFEDRFAKYIGIKYSVFVNSGSSALLLLFLALVWGKKIDKGSTIVVPCMSWATDVSSILFANLNIKFVDCNMQDLSLDLEELENLLIEDKTISTVLLVSVLGLVPNMQKIKKLCNKYGVILIEDVCESFGSEFDNKKLGSFGYASVFSTYFGHPISTIEGGFVCTNNKEFYNILKSMRSHGWDRDLDTDIQIKLRSKYNIDEFKAKFSFYYPGLNVRPTDLQAYIGKNQLKKIKNIVDKRYGNYLLFKNTISNKMWKPQSNGVTSNFAYPFISRNKHKIVAELTKAGIETRSLICGNMENQPYIRELFNIKTLSENASTIDNFGFYVPNHPGITFEDIKLICSIVERNNN